MESRNFKNPIVATVQRQQYTSSVFLPCTIKHKVSDAFKTILNILLNKIFNKRRYETAFSSFRVKKRFSFHLLHIYTSTVHQTIHPQLRGTKTKKKKCLATALTAWARLRAPDDVSRVRSCTQPSRSSCHIVVQDAKEGLYRFYLRPTSCR